MPFDNLVVLLEELLKWVFIVELKLIKHGLLALKERLNLVVSELLLQYTAGIR